MSSILIGDVMEWIERLGAMGIEVYLLRKWAKESPDTKKRTCLMCGKEFTSPGPGVRRCNKCRNHLSRTKRDGRDIVSFSLPKE